MERIMQFGNEVFVITEPLWPLRESDLTGCLNKFPPCSPESSYMPGSSFQNKPAMPPASELQWMLAEQTLPRRHPWQWPPFQAGQSSYLPKRHCLIDSSASKQMYHISVWDAPASQGLKIEHIFIIPAKYSAMDDDCSLQQVWTCESL